MKAVETNSLLAVFLSVFLFGACLPDKNRKDDPSIEFWYGEDQLFGNNGVPQKWINIPGNIKAEEGIKSAFYQLNNDDTVELTWGSDLHRLAAKGDFNVDFAFDRCKAGSNKVKVSVVDSIGNTASKSVEFTLVKNKRWQLPYTIRWSEVENIQNVVQVVDGHWVITEDGLHNLDVYYDRMVAFGDTSWKDYEVTTTVTFHDFTPPEPGPPTYDVSHAAIATRWPGHTKDDLQPHRQWYPLGATSEFRITAGLDSCRWRIFDGPKPDSKRFYVEQSFESYRKMELNKTYGMKHRVESVGEGNTKYSVKLWPIEQEEPAEWDFSGIENNENVCSGSAALIAHNTSVTFGDIYVQPVEK